MTWTVAEERGICYWTQTYTFDRYGNKLTTVKSGITANSAAIPLDGLASQTYGTTTNKINGTSYDHAGNMTRGKAPNGTFQRFEYDAANRLVKIKTDAGALLEEYTYGADRQRVKKTVTNGDKTYYAWGGSSVIAEYKETASQTTMNWSKSYIYAGSRLLSTITKNGASETTEYHHPDRLGTKLVTNTSLNTAKSQATLPFGTEITAETQATSNQKFTSYDRSGTTGLDYAVNRTYNSGQSRFTQVDPIGMASTSIGDPQSLNLFAYTQNNPIDFVDPSGLLLAAPAQYSCTTTRVWGHFEDGNGNITGYASYSSTVCQDGGGGGGSRGNDKKREKKKRKCKQNKDGGDVPAIKEQIEKAGLSGFISNIRREREGITFDINNRSALLKSTKSDARFAFDTPFGGLHVKDVGATKASQVIDIRSYTSGNATLGADVVSGRTRSLQIIVGQPGVRNPITGVRGPSRGYADLDCDNPAQDAVGFTKHTVKVVGGKVKKAARKFRKGIKKVFKF